jgi:hypothetical protein
VTGFRLQAAGFRRAWAALLIAAAACSTGAPRGSMTEEERTYRAKCTSCHRVYQPAEETPQQWAATLDKMVALKKVTLTPEERAQILQYLARDAQIQPQSPLR